MKSFFPLASTRDIYIYVPTVVSVYIKFLPMFSYLCVVLEGNMLVFLRTEDIFSTSF